MFIAQTGCGKTHLVLDLIENQYYKHFDCIVIICPTLKENNETYHAREWIKNEDKVWLVDLPMIISINGLKSCKNCYDSPRYYS